MSQDSTVAAAPPRSFLQRVVGVVFSPGETMASVAAFPKWVDVLALVTVLMAVGIGLLLSTEVGKAALVDQQVASMESWGQTVTAEQYAGFQRMAGMMAIIQPATILFFSPIITAGVAGLLYGFFVVLGGEARYKQVLAVVAHAGVISLLQMLFQLPINYQRQSLSSATNLSVFFPDLPDGSFLASLLGFIDVFWIWYLVVLAIWALILLWSKPWLERFRYGPFEWLWRTLTRWQPQPLRRAAAAP